MNCRQPGALSRWMEEHFVFEGGPTEKEQIMNALFRLESQWRLDRKFDGICDCGLSRTDSVNPRSPTQKSLGLVCKLSEATGEQRQDEQSPCK